MSVNCDHAIRAEGCTVEPCLYQDGEVLGYRVLWPPLVLSMVYASVGAWVGLQYSQNLRTVASLKWYIILLLGLSFSFSILSIWTMHFVAISSIILGQKGQTLFYAWEETMIPINDRQFLTIKYNIYWTVLSAFCIFSFSVLGFHVVAWRPLDKTFSPSFWRTILGGALLAAGVALMHFVGLHAQGGAFRIVYNYLIILGVGGLDIAVCIVAAFCFFWLPSMTMIRVVVSFVVGGAAFTVHYAGMFPLTYSYSDSEEALGLDYFSTEPLIFALALSICQVSLEAVVVAYEYQKAVSSNRLLESLIRMVKGSRHDSAEGDRIFASTAFREAGAFNVHVTVQALPRRAGRQHSSVGPAFDGNLADFVKFMSRKMSRRRIARPGPSGETGENTDVQGFQRESIEGDPICESQGAEDAGNGAADTVVVDHTAGFAPGAMDPINPLRDTSNQVLQIAGNVIHRLVVQKSTSRLAHLHDIRETRPLAGKDTTEKMEKGLDMKGDPQQPEEKGARVTFPESSGEENHKDSHQLDTWNDQGIAEEEATVSPVASQKLSRPGDRGAPK